LKKLIYILISIFLIQVYIYQVLCQENDFEFLLNETFINKNLDNYNSILSFEGIDFGFVQIGNSDIKNIYITNNGINNFEIKSVRISGREGTTFSIMTTYSYPKIVGPGEKVKYEIQFAPILPQNFLDSLLIFVSHPVQFVYSIPLSGASIIENIVWTPDTAAVIGVSEFKLPIKVQNTNKDIFISGLSYRLIISFDAALFYPIGVSKGKIEKNEIFNGQRILTISDDNISLYGTEQLLTEIIGYILLGNNNKTIINIQDIIWDKNWIHPNSKNGELYTYGLCGNTINQIKLKEDSDIKINPNPANQIINIHLNTNENGILDVQIFSVTGILCLKKSIEINNPNKEQIDGKYIIATYELPSGYYYIIITSPNKRFALPLSIVK